MQGLHFTAIDFETANNSRNSICQIGICRVENDKAVFLDSFLVQPPNNEYSHWNVCIHGISPDQTVCMPFFPEVWEKVKTHFEGQLLIAHNASFDCDCLAKTLEHYNIKKPSYRVDCTYAKTGLNLEDLAEALDIQIVSHHNAMYDAMACAEAYIKLQQGHEPDHNKITKEEKKSPFEGHGKISGDLLKPCFETADMNSPFYRKKIVFTGVLDGISREDAAKLVKHMGADIDTGVTKRTDIVIVGSGAGPCKLKKIEEYNRTGSNIRIIYECEFLKTINNN